MNEMVNKGTREFWDGEGGHKWLRFHKRLDASLALFGHKAMASATLFPGERVLDIGCGCGNTSFDIARRVGESGHVQGIDISELILARARNRYTSEPQHNVHFECADIQSCLLEKNTFDVAFSRFGVMFFDDPVAAFNNIREALVPNGRLAFVCWQPIKNNQWVKLPLDIVVNHISLNSPWDPEDPGAFSFGDANRIDNILHLSGFSNISIEQFNAPFNVGDDLDDAVTFLSQVGPASAAINAPDIDAAVRLSIARELRDTLTAHKTERGVMLNASTWIVTANCT